MKRISTIGGDVIKIGVLIFILNLAMTSCKKMIEVDLPIDKNTAAEVYNNPTLASYAITGIYARLARFDGNGGSGLRLSAYPAIMADELKPMAGGDQFYKNNYNINDDFFFWRPAYLDVIYPANSVIEGISASSVVNGAVKDRLIGEAKFIRAWMYFYLVNFYGDVPLVLSTDFKVNTNIPRTSKELVYDQIVNDLLDAQSKLTDYYLSVDLTSKTSERVRPNKVAATALLARVYLYQSDWANAETEASKVIDNHNYKLTEINDVFLKNSEETIWSLQPSLSDANGNINTGEGRVFLPSTSRFPQVQYTISDFLYSDFEINDKRKDNWIGEQSIAGTIYRFPFKYKMGNKDDAPGQEQKEYIIVLRLAEQYLIRAESRAHLGKIGGLNSATEDLNTIRTRAGLNSNKPDESEIQSEIMRERRIELFTEFGHHWLDLKRTNAINATMSNVAPVKGTVWIPYKSLLPIPASEFSSNPALRGHQNPGYNEL